MRILIFTAYYLPHIGGYTLGTHELAKGLNADVITCNTTKGLEVDNIDGVRVYRIPCWQPLHGEYAVPIPSIKTLRLLWRLYHTDYDLVITDLNLPVMRGDIIAEKVKQKSPKSKVVIMSGDLIGMVVKHVDCILQKPKDLMRIREKIEQLKQL